MSVPALIKEYSNRTTSSVVQDRRSFLVNSAVAATTAVSGNRVLGANERIRMGFIGIGNRGPQLLELLENQTVVRQILQHLGLWETAPRPPPKKIISSLTPEPIGEEYPPWTADPVHSCADPDPVYPDGVLSSRLLRITLPGIHSDGRHFSRSPRGDHGGKVCPSTTSLSLTDPDWPPSSPVERQKRALRYSFFHPQPPEDHWFITDDPFFT